MEHISRVVRSVLARIANSGSIRLSAGEGCYGPATAISAAEESLKMRYWLIKAENDTQAYLGRYELEQVVILCRDCKYRDGRKCTWNKAPVLNPFDFCSRGKRREDETD